MDVGVVVPCTDSKVGTLQSTSIRDLSRGLSQAKAVRSWVARLDAAESIAVARDLYKGPGWVASTRLVDVLDGTDAKVHWRIISAGYGLLHPDDRVTRYSATFLSGLPDSVPDDDCAAGPLEGWWEAVNRLRGQRRPLESFASKVDGLVVAASAPYVDAISSELLVVSQSMPVVVFCAGRPRMPAVAALVPRFDRRLREGPDAFVRGGDVGFNQRIAARVVELLGPEVLDRARVDEVLAAAMDREGPVRHGRQGASDAAVMAFIDATLTSDPSASRTALLRRWRDAGRACEQGRFGALYERVVAERDGQLTLGEAACG